MNKVAVGAAVKAFLWTFVPSYFTYIPRSGIAGHGIS